MLEHVGADYKERKYNSFEDWGPKKQEPSFDFANLPYIEDNDFRLTESLAIIKYVARKYDRSLLGKNSKD